jgi:hypothetical protein
VAWPLQPPYKRSKGSALTRMGSEPLLSAPYCAARLAARTSTVRAHAANFTPAFSAAISQAALSAPVSLICRGLPLRSSGGFLGAPRLVFMPKL